MWTSQLRLSLRIRLLLLTIVPTIGLVGIGGVYLRTVYAEYAGTRRDLQVMEAYGENLTQFIALSNALKAERDAALLLARPEADPASREHFLQTAKATDAQAKQLLASIDNLTASPHRSTFEERAKQVRETYATLLPEVRDHVLSGNVNSTRVIRAYIKLIFTALYISENYRQLLTQPETFNYYDGLLTLAKIHEQEMIVTSIIHHGAAAPGLVKDDLATLRKQFFAMTESEYYLRKFLEPLRARYAAALTTDEVSASYYKYLTQVAGTVAEAIAVPQYNPGKESLDAFVARRNASYGELVAFGRNLTLHDLSGVIQNSRRQAWLLGGVISALTLLTVVGNLIIAKSTRRQLSSISADIDATSGEVQSASEQLTAASSRISDNASSYAAAIEEISASMRELSATAQSSNEHAVRARQIATSAKSAVNDGMGAISELDTVMGSVTDSSRKITQIIARINDISFQTNLLALNAAVEAARAGAAGAGFSVVADEVRRLAQHCAEAAAETAGLINTSTRETEQAISKSADVTTFFKAIAANVNDVDSSVTQITENLQSQVLHIDQINSAIATQEEVAQSTAAGAEQTNASAYSLQTQVASLGDSVGQLDRLLGDKRHPTDGQQETFAARSPAPARS